MSQEITLEISPDQLDVFLDQFVCSATRKQTKKKLMTCRVPRKSEESLEIPVGYECNVGQLKKIAKERGLSVGGKKADLIERLKEYDRQKDKEAGYIELYCKTLMGRYYDIKIKRSDKVSVLKNKISEKSGIPLQRLKLYGYTTLGQRNQTPLDDDLSVGDNDLYPGSSVYIHMRLIG